MRRQFYTPFTPHNFAHAVDFTTTHTWWLSDALLWDSLTAKTPACPCWCRKLVCNPKRCLMVPRAAHRRAHTSARTQTRRSDGDQRGLPFEWLWNTNAYMTQESEVQHRRGACDATEKPEATVMRAMARFVSSVRGHMNEPHTRKS